MQIVDQDVASFFLFVLLNVFIDDQATTSF
jgi:hypothetical protein